MITMDVNPLFIGVCLTFLVNGCCGQKILFPDPIQYEGLCGVSDGQGNWSTTGNIQLTNEDQIMFAPKLEVQTCSPTCTLDLTKCLSQESNPGYVGGCFCQKQSNGLIKVYISAQGDPAQSGLSVQASIPSNGNFGPIKAATVIGIIPTIPEKRPPVKPTYQVDGDLVQPFLPVQTIKVCPNVFVTIKICVEDKAPRSVLKVNLNHMNKTTDNKCLEETKKFHFELTTSHKMIFSYRDSIDCTDFSTLFIGEKQSGCHATTPQVKEYSTPQITDTTTPQIIESSTPQVTEATTPQTTTPKPRLQDCSTPDIMNLLSPGMVQLCDQDTDGGNWTVIQRRTSGKVDFFRKWNDYENGFGEQPDNFWLGLKAIHHLCYPRACQLRFDLKYKGENYYAKYDSFTVEGADTNYKMFVSGYHGDAGDNGKGFLFHNGMSFTTTDRDNDDWSTNCSDEYRGGWWYRRCHYVNLNGEWGNKENGKGLNWFALTGGSNYVTLSEMKVRQQN